MTGPDMIRFAARSVTSHRARTALMLVAMAVGVASVITLTALGEAARRYVMDEFTALGTHLLIVLPGRSETTGGAPPLLGETPRDLTLEDAFALGRSRLVRRMAPVVLGSAPVAYRERDREVIVIGTTEAFREVRQLRLAHGRFLPEGDPRRAAAVCVLGAKLERELFGSGPALGRWVRIGDRRFRVIGVLASEGQSIGLDVGDMALMPAASAQALFNTQSLFRILLQARSREDISRARDAVLAIIRSRHEGEDDVTVITQDAVVSTFDRVLGGLTLTVAGIASVSLVVAGILVMNVMLVAVSQRTAEIGLLKAIGAARTTVVGLFLAEAILLCVGGAVLGLGVGWAAVALAGQLFPDIPFAVPPWVVLAALVTAFGSGLLFGVTPARRAADLDAVAALNRR